jgi:hypothetical protein
MRFHCSGFLEDVVWQITVADASVGTGLHELIVGFVMDEGGREEGR